MLRFLRVTHLYIGVFIAPALLFFAFTGALQTAGLHEPRPGTTYKPPHWAEVLGQLHKKQTIEVRARKPQQYGPKTAPAPAPKPALAPDASAPVQKNHYPMKFFFLMVSLGLFISTLSGIFMAYKYQRNNVLVTVLLVLGVLVPLVLLKF